MMARAPLVSSDKMPGRLGFGACSRTIYSLGFFFCSPSRISTTLFFPLGTTNTIHASRPLDIPPSSSLPP